MQTFLKDDYLQTPEGRDAGEILRSCVHCGFCNATCPTFLLTGNELDGPRGRIYLIKQALEGNEVTHATQRHLDRCLCCQACETTCPSSVRYHDLLGIGRRHVEEQVGRAPVSATKRALIRHVLVRPRLLGLLHVVGSGLRPLLPPRLRARIPLRRRAQPWPRTASARRVILLSGCAQGVLSPNTNAAAARVLARLGIEAIPLEEEGCCGSLAFHMNAQEESLARARQLVDLLDARLGEVEAIVSTASGCGNFLKTYDKLLAQDPQWRDKAARVAAKVRDISEVLRAEDLSALKLQSPPRLAFQCPCTLQHGQRLSGAVEEILERLHFNLSPVSNPHLCCGSAGSYSLLEPKIAQQLRADKLATLEADAPDAIATANIGCQLHLGGASAKPVRHWIEYVDEALKEPEGRSLKEGA